MLVKTEGDVALWWAVGASVRGASHRRNDLPNQDAIGWAPESGSGLPIVMAVADGHGSAKSTRSALGSSLAVMAALESVRQFLMELREDQPHGLKRLAQEQLARNLVRRWTDAVENDLAERPLTDAELRVVESRDGSRARQVVEKGPLISYGTTILAVGVTRSFVLYLQLGDGDILAVSHDGAVHRPVPRDPRLIANETTSLCSATAVQDFRIGLQVLSESPPALILASTDGYVNSFEDDAAFDKVGLDILAMLRTGGIDVIAEGLESWLAETSQMGSGDDVTVGMLCRMDILADKPSPRPEEE